MKRLLVIVTLALSALALGGGAAKAAPCFIAPAGGCAHWSDYSRPGTVPIHENFQVNAAAWQSAANARNTYFNSNVANVKVGNLVPAPSGNAACNNIPYNAYAFKITACTRAFNDGSWCANNAPNDWIACAQYYSANDPTTGAPTNHIVWVVIRFKDPGVFNNGWTFNLTAADRNMLWCHETLGHGFGMTHTGPPQSPPFDPASPNDSCLYYQINSNPLLGGTVISQINSNHGHPDSTTDYAGIGSATKQDPKRRKVASVLQLRPGKTDDGRPYYIVPDGLKAPIGLRSASYAGALALEPPPFNSFRGG